MNKLITKLKYQLSIEDIKSKDFVEEIHKLTEYLKANNFN
jgi:hypothetical protein